MLTVVSSVVCAAGLIEVTGLLEALGETFEGAGFVGVWGTPGPPCGTGWFGVCGALLLATCASGFIVGGG